jgi:hypothetical protein
MESPGHWLNASSTGDIFGRLTGNVFRWYLGGRLNHGLGSEEGLRAANQR